MTIKQLSEEQIRDWTLEEKDRWWLENVYRGHLPQLTFRAAFTGFLLGGILCSTNLYIGAKTGWSLGVGITSVILAFASFRVLAKLGLAKDISILENNCSQSIATAAAYMTSPLISSMVAYMLITNQMLPWHQLVLWNVVVSILGVLFAFPLKRMFINDQQQPFPEGQAAGMVLDTLHEADSEMGMKHARVLFGAASIAGLIKFFQAESIQGFLQQKLLGIKEAWRIPEHLNVLWEKLGLHPKLAGVDINQLTLAPSLELSLIGAGGLMGIRAGTSLLLGAIVNYAILAPLMISLGEITPANPDAETLTYGMKRISLWALWPGVACLAIASLMPFVLAPQMIVKPIKMLFQKKQSSDVLSEIELPLWISILGVPIVTLVAAWMANEFFGVDYWACIIGLPLTFVLTVVAANSTALTSITPISGTAKITQLFYGIVRPGQIQTNIATASLTAETVSNASNLLMDLKPGYMLGAKPRLQAIAHCIGIISGSVFSVPLFFLLFTAEVETKGLESIQSEKFPMPAVTTWRAIAEVLTNGLAALPETAKYAALAGLLIGMALEVSKKLTRGRFPILAVPFGLAFIIDFPSSFAMFLGSFLLWCLGVGRGKKESEPTNEMLTVHTKKSWWNENYESVCAGIIAGAALMGVLDQIVAVLDK